MGSEIVCQVIGRPDQVTFIWSEGPASFEPYQLTGQGFVAFRNLANQAREALSVLVKDYLQGTDEDLRRSGFALAKVGHKLYQQVFRPAAGPSQYVAKRARSWLGELYGYGQIQSLEIVMDGFGPIPWNVVYDQEPKESDFLSGEDSEHWRPFWGLRYNLAGGRRVEPLRRLPWLVNPKLLMVIDPAIHDGLPAEQKARLEEFVLNHEVRVAVTKEALTFEMEDRRPDVMYWLCHASASALILNGEEVSPGDLLDLFRSQADDDRLGGIAFLNACQTAESTEEGGSFMDALHEVGLSGVIATEQQTVDTFAHPFGLDFLEAFLYEGRPVGHVLQDLRSKGVPLGLLYSTYCPPGLRVMKAEGSSEERKLLSASRMPGVFLSAPALDAPPAPPLEEARRSTTPREPIPLPDAPYRLLAPFERRDRALFVGRDDDIRRFSLILDDHQTRLFVLHGESGVGKSSFLRAGVIPYLEDECVGYHFLALRSGDLAEPEPRFIRATADLIGQVARVLCEFCARGYSYRTHSAAKLKRAEKRSKSGRARGRRPGLANFGMAEVDLSEIAAELVGGPLRPEVVAAKLRADAGLFGRLMREISARLPRAPVLVIDQAEEVFTLARTEAEVENGRLAMAMLRRAMAESGNFKVIVSLRTEYYGRLVDRLRSGVREAVGLREYLLTEFRAKGLVEALLRPTSSRAIEGSSEIPFEKYGFRYDAGVAERIAREVLDGKLAGQDSVLPLIQVIGSQLVEAAARPGAVIGHADLDAIGGVKGGMRRHVEQMVDRLFRDRPSDARAFRKLMTRLYLRQPDGALTTALMPLDGLEAGWKGRAGFKDMIDSAVGLRLLNVDVFDVDGADGRPYASLGHDALARVAAAWDEELRRFERLRKMIAATAASLLLAGVMTALAGVALVQKSRAEEATRRAIAYLDETVHTLDRSLIGVADVELVDVPQMVTIRAKLLEDARGGFAHLMDQFEGGRRQATGAERPAIRRGLGRAYRYMGNIERLVGQHTTSKKHLAQAIALLGEAQPGGSDKGDAELARAHYRMGETLRMLDEIDASEEHLRKAIKLREAYTQADPEARLDLAASHYALAALLAEFTDRFGDSEAEYRAAIRLLLGGTHEPSTEARYKDNFGRLELLRGQVDEASALFDEAGKILKVRTDSNPATLGLPGVRWQLARVANNRALILYRREGRAGRPEALRLFEESRKALELLLAEFPEIEPYRKELALVEQNLAATALEEARIAFDEWAEQMKANASKEAGTCWDKAGILLEGAGADFKRSIELLQPIPPSGGSSAPVAEATPAEVEWPRIVAQAELHVVEAWQDGVNADLAPLDDDLLRLEGMISRLEGKGKVDGPRLALPKYRQALASEYYAKYEFIDFILAHFPHQGERATSLRRQARAALDAAIEQERRAPVQGRLAEYVESRRNFVKIHGERTGP